MMKPLFFGALLFCWAASTLRADEPPAWSATVNGLRGRLLVPKESSTDPFLRIKLELENVANVLDNRHLRLAENSIVVRVVDKAGQPLAPARGVYDGFTLIPETLVLPFDSTLFFAINEHGLGVAPSTREIVDFGPMNSWILPVGDGHIYFMSASLTITRAPNDHPFLDWSGILDLPKVRLPSS